MNDQKKLAEQLLTADLLSPAALREIAEVSPPEKYELVECLGRGGFGVVFKARDRSLDRFVALKFLIGAGRAELERFRREARFTARLNDPAIVQVYEFGQSDGQPYIAMQYIDGRNLAKAELAPESIVRAVCRVAEALQYAHDEGIVHRDLKPENILIDHQGRPYVTDFGIARQEGDGVATLSRTGALMGTPALMSPEQAKGELHSIDARSDIYSLGATLYRLVCRRYPFQRSNVVELLHAVIHDDPPLPRSIDPSIPRGLEAVMLKCLQKSRRDRYGSMAELSAELSDYLAGRPLATESSAWFRRLVGVKPAGKASEPDLFEALGWDVAREIAGWDANLYRVSKNVSRFYPQLEGIIHRLAAIIAESPDYAWARFYRGMALRRRGRLDEALDEMERSIDRLANKAGAHFEIGRLYLALFLEEQLAAGKHISAAGRREHMNRSLDRLQQAEVAFEAARGADRELVAWQIEFTRAISRLAAQDYDGCVESCDRILDDDPDLEEVWKLRGDAIRLAGGDPMESYDRAIEVRRSYHDAHMAKAETYLDRQQWADARRCLGIGLELYPDCNVAPTLLGRSYLLEVQALDETTGAASDLLEAGLAHSRGAVELEPGDYDAVVTHAELLIELGHRTGKLETLESALSALASASHLKGCANRVNYLATACRMHVARIRAGRGTDVRTELGELASEARHAARQAPDCTQWRELADQLDALVNV